MAMIALSPVGSSWQNTTCSWPVARAKTPTGTDDTCGVPVTVVTLPWSGPRGCAGLVWTGALPAGVVRGGRMVQPRAVGHGKRPRSGALRKHPAGLSDKFAGARND